jgi:polyphenol oxidase
MPAANSNLALTATNLPYPWLLHGFTTRAHSTMKSPDARARFLAELGAGKTTLVTLKQVHSDIIHIIATPPNGPLTGDGLVTRTPNILLGIQTADCLPVLLADPEHQAIGAFHAGWRGTLARIVEKGVGVMRREFASDPAQLRAAIGPGIHACCYAVGDEVHDQFRSQFAYADELFAERWESDPVREKYPLLFLTARAPGHFEHGRRLYLDLVAANRRQLLDAGVLDAHISASELCTACRTDLLFSHRAEKGNTGRMLAVIGIRA